MLFYILIWLMGACVGGAAATAYIYFKQQPFGVLKINQTDPSDEFLTVILYRELKALETKDEITLKIERR